MKRGLIARERRNGERRMGLATAMSGMYANARVNVCFVICDSAGSRIMRRKKKE
jgi:hypothetical protein